MFDASGKSRNCASSQDLGDAMVLNNKVIDRLPGTLKRSSAKAQVHLFHVARRLGIRGRSRMNKDDLVAAID